MKIPDNLLNEVKNGRVVLCLGSGASKGASNKAGQQPPDGNQLARILSDKFLGGKYKDQSLAWISEIAISENDLRTVQDFIKEIFEEFTPAEFHYLLPTFQWRGIATTNYDLLVETCYSRDTTKSIQKLVPIISNSDRFDEKLRTKEHLGLLKLHGCISRTGDKEVPLILTVDQYVTHKKGRSRLFSLFEEWGYEHPIVFIGQSLIDADLRQIILELDKQHLNRPRYYLVKPNVTEEEVRLWESRRITVLEGTYEDFLCELNDKIPSVARKIIINDTIQHPIESKFRKNEPLPQNCLEFLENDCEFVHKSMSINQADPSKFYKGFDLGWYPIERKLDVRRSLTDTMLHEIFLISEEERIQTTEFYVLKAEAGAGKSILLRRLAWEAATEANSVCI